MHNSSPLETQVIKSKLKLMAKVHITDLKLLTREVNLLVSRVAAAELVKSDLGRFSSNCPHGQVTLSNRLSPELLLLSLEAGQLLV